MDNLVESVSRTLATRTSRRGVLGLVGKAIIGAAIVPLLPVSRAAARTEAAEIPGAEGNPLSCDYWRYCGLDGLICGCCGGSATECPPGTFSSPTGWVGTCRNPKDGKDYIVAYRDCCGKNLCSRCMCENNQGDMPIYRTQADNTVFWCFGSKSFVVNCTTSVVLGVRS
ncbi:MAG: methylamine dehydrogenase light chain [Candidatus Binataceae bacterium]